MDFEAAGAVFFKIYSNLPINERNSPVVVLDIEPISWSMAYREISNKTELGKKIVKKMLALKIL